MLNKPLSRRGLLGGVAASLAVSSATKERPVPLPEGKVRAVLDTDAFNEIDDQFAIAHALLSPESISLEAIYAAPFVNDHAANPNTGMEQSYEEILRVLEALNRTDYESVHKGSRAWMAGPAEPVESPAAKDLIQRAMVSPERLYVMAVGAPTNVSSAILMEPEIKDRITVVWIGGQPHHHPSASDYNTGQDAHAARVLFNSGVPLMEVTSYNVCELLMTTSAELDRFIQGRSKIGDYLYGIFRRYEERRNPGFAKPYSKVIWDLAAVAWLINPDWVPSVMAPSPVLTGELTWRQKAGRHRIRVSTRVNRDPVFADLFRKLSAA